MNKEERLKYLQSLIADEPEDPFPHYAYILERIEHEVDFGVQLWEGFQTQFPDYLPAYFLAGKAMQSSGNSVEAIEIWKKGIQLAENQNDRHALAELKSELINAMIDDD